MTGSASEERATLGVTAQRVARSDGATSPATVWIDSPRGVVTAITEGGSDASGARGTVRRVDLGERFLLPGYLDMHVHGGAGAQVNGNTPDQVEEALATIASFHAQHGTTGLLATTVTDTPERLAASVAGIARAVHSSGAAGARIMGSHLEGPFVALGRAGAQDPSQIRPPDRTELNRLLELGEGTVRLVTLAPELEGADRLIADCLDAGAAVALGHTNAAYGEGRRAFDAGASHVTHLCNAMAPLHHRNPGLVTAALLHPSVTLEIICDLHHVHPAVVALVARAAPGRLVLVTDAIPAAGLAPGRQVLGHMPIEVVGTRATLLGDPTTLAGSVLTMEVAVRNAVDVVGIALADAFAAASSVPAGVLGASAPRLLGTLLPGAPADAVVLEPTLRVTATLVGGVPVYDPGGIFT